MSCVHLCFTTNLFPISQMFSHPEGKISICLSVNLFPILLMFPHYREKNEFKKCYSFPISPLI